MEFGELQKVHAGAGRGQAVVCTCILDAEGRIKLFKAEERRTGAAGDEFEQMPLPTVVELVHHSPKSLDDWMDRSVAARVVRVQLKVLHIHRGVSARDENLQLAVAERLEPLEIDHIG